ncbi:MAG: hypothetical protein AAFP81_16420 [Pseudomonadota bacterium]
MAAQRKSKSHETGDAKMKAAAIRSVNPGEKAPKAVPSPAKELQDQLQSHYTPLSKRMAVILISFLVAFAFIGGWLGGSGAVAFA